MLIFTEYSEWNRIDGSLYSREKISYDPLNQKQICEVEYQTFDEDPRIIEPIFLP
ncbi:MAG: hypothetical protein LBV67_09390 [Streptococcaceae bacterium]|jgi:hypothetical protein|nr:hypothetical protein [Streptococcaceae bacterium]